MQHVEVSRIKLLQNCRVLNGKCRANLRRQGDDEMHQSYPHMQFRQHWELTPEILYQLGQCSSIIYAIANIPIPPDRHHQLLHISLTKGARATTAIEGNTLTEEEVAAIERGIMALPPSKAYQEQEIKNILTAMNGVLEQVKSEQDDPLLCGDLLREFHRTIGKDLGEHFDAIPGRFREDSRFVGTYRCPDHRDVPELIESLCKWLSTHFHFRHGQTFAEAVIEAIVSHVYIEWIHPFGDGNGRTGRLVEFYFLLRAGTPDIASHILSNHYNDTRPEYYRQLDKATKSRDLTEFIAYAMRGYRDGLVKTLERVQEGQFETTWKRFVYDTFSDRKITNRVVFTRQRKLALAFPLRRALTLDEIAVLTPELSRAYVARSEQTLQRDLRTLIELGLVERVGEAYRATSDILIDQQAQRSRKRLFDMGDLNSAARAPQPEVRVAS